MAAAVETSLNEFTSSSSGAEVPENRIAQGLLSSAATHPLNKKIQRVLKLRVDNADIPEALSCLSSFYNNPSNTGTDRRLLRSSIESEKVRIYEEFLDNFKPVNDILSSVSASIRSLDESCNAATKALADCKTSTHEVLELARKLRHDRDVIQDKRKVSSLFLTKLKLSESSANTLTNSASVVDDSFFVALEELGEVRNNARKLVAAASQTNPDVVSVSDVGAFPVSSSISTPGLAGVDVLQDTSDIIETAYETLFVWVQQQCRSIASVASGDDAYATSPSGSTWSTLNLDEDNPNSHGSLLRKALGILKERPIYFNHCARDIAKIRRHMLVQRFHEALCKGGPNGHPKPIELHAYDPVRYVGDMLAWVHQAAASEKEFALAFCRLTSSLTSSSNHKEQFHMVTQSNMSLTGADRNDDDLVLSSNLLDNVFEGLVIPFRKRVEQAANARPNIIQMYKMSQLLDFFACTLAPLMTLRSSVVSRSSDVFTNIDSSGDKDSKIQSDAPAFVKCCRELHEATNEGCLALWEKQAMELPNLPYTSLYAPDLSAPLCVVDAVHTLKGVLVVYNSALVPHQQRSAQFSPILDASLNPLINACHQVAHNLSSPNSSIYLINVFVFMQQPLTKYDFTSSRVELLASLIEDQMDILIASQTNAVLGAFGFSERLDALKTLDIANKPDKSGEQLEALLSTIPSCTRPSLSSCYKSFYSSLFTNGALSLTLIDKLSSRSLRSQGRNSVARNVAAAYETLHISTKSLGVATHTPDQIRTLLDAW